VKEMIINFLQNIYTHSLKKGRFPLSLRVGISALLFFVFFSTAPSSASFSPEKAGFAVEFKNHILPYKVAAIYVMPREKTSFKILDKNRKNTYAVSPAQGNIRQESRNRWIWQAPEQKGLYPMTIKNTLSNDSITLNVFVLVPYYKIQNGYLNGCRIGDYPQKPLKNLSIYKHPKGFVEVTEKNHNTLLSPHFRLRQFICKQDGGYPTYVVLEEQLILKLEFLLDKLNSNGFSVNSFVIMSGYRTPYYNEAIGNVAYSRHLWGDAADIYIDENPRDGVMDDLNHDGKIDIRDAAVLYHFIDNLYKDRDYKPFIGGLGKYNTNRAHGPFVHVDVRGRRARWGR